MEGGGCSPKGKGVCELLPCTVSPAASYLLRPLERHTGLWKSQADVEKQFLTEWVTEGSEGH